MQAKHWTLKSGGWPMGEGKPNQKMSKDLMIQLPGKKINIGS
jgi:hypothetical protein